MRMHEPLLYLPHMLFNGQQIDPAARVNCPLCKQPFILARGVAFEASAGGDPTIGFFCTEECYLNGFPVQCCGRA